jgi:hypothetical protein
MAGYGGWLTLIAATFEGIVFLSALLLVAVLAPAAGTPGFEFSDLFKGSGEESPGWDLYDGLCYVIAVSVVDDLRRRRLLPLSQPARDPRGWDIELCGGSRSGCAVSGRWPRR